MSSGRPKQDADLVVVLSGWSDGPLDYLVEALKHRGLRCVFVPLPMPPCGCYWCANPFLVLLGVVVWGVVAASRAASGMGPTARPVATVAVLLIGAALARVCVAGVVRFATAHGVLNATRRLERSTALTQHSKRVALVVGFSWGGGVAHALVARRRWRGPTLLLAPTTILNARIAMFGPAEKRFDDPSLVSVVTAVDDPFCPNPATAALYEKIGCDVAQVDDAHALCGRGAYEAVMDAVDRLLSPRLLEDGDGDSGLTAPRGGAGV